MYHIFHLLAKIKILIKYFKKRGTAPILRWPMIRNRRLFWGVLYTLSLKFYPCFTRWTSYICIPFCFSYRHLWLPRDSRRWAYIPRRRYHLRVEKEPRWLVWGSSKWCHRTVPWQLRWNSSIRSCVYCEGNCVYMFYSGNGYMYNLYIHESILFILGINQNFIIVYIHSMYMYWKFGTETRAHVQWALNLNYFEQFSWGGGKEHNVKRGQGGDMYENWLGGGTTPAAPLPLGPDLPIMHWDKLSVYL